MKTDSFDKVFKNKNTIMVVMPHPDDLELYCGGTLARLLSSGKEVISVKMTNGGKGTKQSFTTEQDLGMQRSNEDKRAASILGIKSEYNFQLNLPDGEIENNLSTIEKVALVIRQFRPDLIISCNPEDVVIRFAPDANWINHRDHRATAQIALDAAYPYSRDTAFFPHQLSEISKPFMPTSEFLLSDYYDLPDLVHIDITDFLSVKKDAWQCYESAYTPEKVNSAVDFLNKDEDSGRYFETFRYVIAD